MFVIHVHMLGFHIEDKLIIELKDIKKELGPIKTGPKIMQLGPYVEIWSILLWIKACIHLIWAEPPFTKGSKLHNSKFGMIAIKRVLYM